MERISDPKTMPKRVIRHRMTVRVKEISESE